MIKPLSREEVRRVVHGEGNAPRVPIALHFWTHPYEFSDPAAVHQIIDKYPEDVQIIPVAIPGKEPIDPAYPDYVWVKKGKVDESRAFDDRAVIDDWGKLDEILENFPTAEDYPGLLRADKPDDGRYRILHWWYFLFERHWELRGMTNALMDFYDYPDEVHALYRKLTDLYIGIIRRAARESHFDAVFTSDDLGTQKSQFFSLDILNEFFLPYYKEVTDAAHELGMDFWLHACGCVDKFIPGFVDAGIDVLHPIQKYTMDEKDIAARFGDKLAIWAGMDVQQTIPYGTPEDVRREVRFLYDTYKRPDGRFLFTAGNGINGDCPLASLEALYDEAYKLTL